MSATSVRSPFTHIRTDLPHNLHLDYHIDLVFTEVRSKETRLILLGDIYDHRYPEKSNADILTECSTIPFPELLLRFARMAGRYVIIVIHLDSIWMFSDMAAYRKIYFAYSNGSLVCSSNQHLLARILGYQPSEDRDALTYYQSEQYKSYLFKDIGDRTHYDEVKQLLPNHYLDLRTGEIRRFWPQPLPVRGTFEIAEEAADMIRGFLHAAANRYPLMIPVTSGTDSRVILAASRKITERVFYYLNDSPQVRKSPDARLPLKMLTRMGLEFHLLGIAAESDEQFRNIYQENNPYAIIEFQEIIFNYLIHYPDRLNIPGNTLPVIKATKQASSKEINAHVLADIYGYTQFDLALSFYEDWLGKLGGICDRTGFDPFDLIFLEEWNCNWAARIQQDKDIGQEEFVVFNSAYLVSLMLTYDKTRRKTPYHGLHKDLIRILWPDLLDYPFNPSSTSSLKEILGKLRIYDTALRLKRIMLGR